jgi:hypothetical protein
MKKDESEPNVDQEDCLVWSRGLGKHSAGEYSFAVAQANDIIEDHSQVETGLAGTFVGVYDGHGGADASRFVAEHLFQHLVSKWYLIEFGTINLSLYMKRKNLVCYFGTWKIEVAQI